MQVGRGERCRWRGEEGADVPYEVVQIDCRSRSNLLYSGMVEHI